MPKKKLSCPTRNKSTRDKLSLKTSSPRQTEPKHDSTEHVTPQPDVIQTQQNQNCGKSSPPITSKTAIDEVYPCNINDMREEFQHEFLIGKNLQHVIAILCNYAGPRHHDPISYTVQKFLTLPIVCGISPCGLFLFLDHPDLLIPFRTMTDTQKTLLRTLQTEKWRDHADINTLMGGGRLFVHFSKTTPITLSHNNVLEAVCRAALNNTQYAPPQKLQAINIIVQRAAAMTNISNHTLTVVNTALQEDIAAMKTIYCTANTETHNKRPRNTHENTL
jgi:hypothetical protein